MVIAFLDLLGFSWLVKNNIVTANNNLYTFNQIIHTKIIDNRVHPAEVYSEENGLREFARNAALSSFDNMISISDSLVIGAQQLFFNLRNHLDSFLTIWNFSKIKIYMI